MKLTLALLSVLCGLSFAGPETNPNAYDALGGSVRYPTIEGLVVMQPGNFDSNVCLPGVFNPSDPRYDGGGFYVQQKNGNSVFVCPEDRSLVNGIKKGDRVRVTGPITTDPVNILTILAEDVEKKSGNGPDEIIKEMSSLANYVSNAHYGDLVRISGFVTEVKFSFPGVGSVFTIKDCDGTEVKGWWTASIDPNSDIKDVFDIDESGVTATFFEMVGFAESYYPMCWNGLEQKEFQPRDVTEMKPKVPPTGCTP